MEDQQQPLTKGTDVILDSASNWDTSTIQDIQFQICTRHQEEAKAFCTLCNSLLCVFCMLNEDDGDDEVEGEGNGGQQKKSDH